MTDFYYFFFSYASANREIARTERNGSLSNHMDRFFDLLCSQLASKVGLDPKTVAYRDRNKLEMGDIWDLGLVDGLQKSEVLIPLISPHYLKSDNCGRELGFFHKRWQEYIRVGGDEQTHRILPLFWENSQNCFRDCKQGVEQFLKRYNFTQEGLPEEYIRHGLYQFCLTSTEAQLTLLCRSIAERVVKLANPRKPLPMITSQGEFSDIESIYTQLERDADKKNIVLAGPSGANVIYLVGTVKEMQSVDPDHAVMYKEEREKWCPFEQSPGATLDLLTQEGVNQAGCKEARTLSLSDDILSLIDTAKQRNSPVLLVLDRCALKLQLMKNKMLEYDTYNHINCGLVTAGGNEISDEYIKEIFRFKSRANYLHHIWSVPINREIFVQSVASVLIGIRKQLMSQGELEIQVNRETIPGLITPSRS